MLTPPITVWPVMPDWVKVSARHTHELPFVFGGIYNSENNIWNGESLQPKIN